MTPKDTEVYEYRCVKPVLAGGGTYQSTCSGPTWVDDGEDTDYELVECPKECSGERCKPFYLKAGEEGYDDSWKRVGPNSDDFKGKFELSRHGYRIKVEDLKQLRNQYIFRCFCLQ